MVWDKLTLLFMAIVFFGIIIPIISLIDLLFFYKKSQKLRLIWFLVIVFVPFGWIGYMLMKDRLR